MHDYEDDDDGADRSCYAAHRAIPLHAVRATGRFRPRTGRLPAVSSLVAILVSQTLLGNTVVAASLEGEEVARVAVPSRRGRGELALGNIAGTILHFTAFNAGLIALVKPLEIDNASRYLHLPAAVAAPLVLCLTLHLQGGLNRAAACVLLALYGAYLAAAVGAA